MWHDLLLALALLLILEGILPFLNPNSWRRTVMRLSELNDTQLRFIGLTFMVVGLVLLIIFVR